MNKKSDTWKLFILSFPFFLKTIAHAENIQFDRYNHEKKSNPPIGYVLSEEKTFEFLDQVVESEISSDSKKVIYLLKDSSIKIVDTESLTVTGTYLPERPIEGGNDISFDSWVSPKGNFLAYRHHDKDGKHLWGIYDFKRQKTLFLSEPAEMVRISFSGDEHYFSITYEGLNGNETFHASRIVDLVNDGKVVYSKQHPSDYYGEGIIFIPGRDFCLLDDRYNGYRGISTSSWKEEFTIPSDSRFFIMDWKNAISPNGKEVLVFVNAASEEGNYLGLADLLKGQIKLKKTYKEVMNTYYSPSFWSPSGSSLVTISDGGFSYNGWQYFHFINSGGSQPTKVWREATQEAHEGSYSPDGRMFFANVYHSERQVYDTTTNHSYRVYPNSLDQGNSAFYRARILGDYTLLSLSYDNVLRKWKLGDAPKVNIPNPYGVLMSFSVRMCFDSNKKCFGEYYRFYNDKEFTYFAPFVAGRWKYDPSNFQLLFKSDTDNYQLITTHIGSSYGDRIEGVIQNLQGESIGKWYGFYEQVSSEYYYLNPSEVFASVGLL